MEIGTGIEMKTRYFFTVIVDKCYVGKACSKINQEESSQTGSNRKRNSIK
jgi:hypothetical protein